MSSCFEKLCRIIQCTCTCRWSLIPGTYIFQCCRNTLKFSLCYKLLRSTGIDVCTSMCISLYFYIYLMYMYMHAHCKSQVIVFCTANVPVCLNVWGKKIWFQNAEAIYKKRLWVTPSENEITGGNQGISTQVW